MVGWMAKERIPIVMITTDKTANDMKGGQIAIVRHRDGSHYVSIVEQAQAKETGQLELFEKTGLEVRRDNQTSFFNTNTALFNYEELVPKLKALVNKIGEEEFLRIVTPDLIENRKEQKDKDGISRKYLQLEGAMGSSLLNLDRFWRAHYQEPLVHFINVDHLHRTDFFSPIKSAFDFFMQFHSDRFRLLTDSMRLKNERPGSLPSVSLSDTRTSDKYYHDVQTVLECFQGTSILGLDVLRNGIRRQGHGTQQDFKNGRYRVCSAAAHR
jgi:UDP-N-acetylglucosamine pyrophosphorylase